MAAKIKADPHLEIAHVLFIDVVGYSKLLVNEQREVVQRLNQVVRKTPQFRKSEATGKLIRIPVGDGMALVFFQTPEEPVQCAMEIARALKKHPRIRLRMGVHSGPVDQVKDVNDRLNVAGTGINIAQRVMDCGDAGHILVSKRLADDLAQDSFWQPHLHELGEIEVKHGARLGIVNLYTTELGNPQPPEKLSKQQVALKPSTASFEDVSETPEKSIAVLPFENLSADPDNAYFADGIQEEILVRLSKIADLKVISRTSTQRYKSAPGNLTEIAKQLGVAHILEGTVQKAADQVRVNVQLINARTDSHLWADRFDRKLTDIFGVESEIATKIANTLQAKLTGSEQHALASRPTQNTEAHQLYLKGRFFWNKRTSDGIKKSIEHFDQAIQKDATYAPAYAGLADAYVILPFYNKTPGKKAYPKAKAAATKALELDDTVAEAHISLATVRFWRDWAAGAEPEYKQGLELSPNYATGHHWYSIYLSTRGRHQEAISEMTKAQELDPFSLVINTELGLPYLYARQYDQAIAHFQKAIEMDPNFAFAHFALAEAYDRKGKYKEALAEHDKAIALAGEPSQCWLTMTGLLKETYKKLGGKGYWQKRLELTKKLYADHATTAKAVAEIYAILGDEEQALGWLEKSYQERDGFLVFLKIQSEFDNMRGHPRFEALVEKIVPRGAK